MISTSNPFGGPVLQRSPLATNPLQFGCRFSVTVADKGGLPPATVSLQVPKTENNKDYFEFQMPRTVYIHTPDGKKRITQGTRVQIPNRINTPIEWLDARHPKILEGIRTGKAGFQDYFFGPAIESKNISADAHRKDLFHGALAFYHNNYNMPIATLGGADNRYGVKVRDVNGPGSLGLDPDDPETRKNMEKELNKATQDAVKNQAKAMIIHHRYATIGEAFHQFEGKIDGIRMGFLHNGSVAKVIEDLPTKAQLDTFMKTEKPRPVLLGSPSTNKPGQLYLDRKDIGALKSGNDSYLYFLLILANLKEISGGNLTGTSFTDANLAKAIAQTGLFLKEWAPFEHPQQKGVPDEQKTYYAGVGYAGAFYITRPDGSTFIMVIEGNKSPLETIFYDPLTRKHIL